MTSGLLTGIGPKGQHSRGRNTQPTLSSGSGLPLAKPSQNYRARKPGGIACRGQGIEGIWEQIENNQHTHVIMADECCTLFYSWTN